MYIVRCQQETKVEKTTISFSTACSCTAVHTQPTRRKTNSFSPSSAHIPPPLWRLALGEGTRLGNRELATAVPPPRQLNLNTNVRRPRHHHITPQRAVHAPPVPAPTPSPRDSNSVSRPIHTWRERILRRRICRGPHPPHGHYDLSGLVHRARARGGSSHGGGDDRRRDCVGGGNRPFPLGRFRGVVDVHHSPTGFLRLPACVRFKPRQKRKKMAGGVT